MAALDLDMVFFSHEIPFCKVYSLESKEKLLKRLLSNRISFFVEWQERNFWQRFCDGKATEKTIYTICINEADCTAAKGLAQGIESVQLGV